MQIKIPLLINNDKYNQPWDQAHILFQAPSLRVVKSMWEVRFSSEGSQARLEAERDEAAVYLIGMSKEAGSFIPHQRHIPRGARGTKFSGQVICSKTDLGIHNSLFLLVTALSHADHPSVLTCSFSSCVHFIALTWL